MVIKENSWKLDLIFQSLFLPVLRPILSLTEQQQVLILLRVNVTLKLMHSLQ